MTQYTVSQGETSTVTLHGGDFLNILSGGTAVSTIANGGTILVNSDGLEQNGTLNSGAFEYVSNGGSATDTTVSGGTLTLSGGGLVVFSGGVAVGLIVEPTATTATPEVVIQAGGTASNTTLIGTVDSGGAYMSVSGGSSIDTIIGDESVESDGIGTVNSGAVVQRGGELVIGDGVHPSQSAGGFGFNISVGGGVLSAVAGTLLSGTIVTNGGELSLFGVDTRAVGTVLSNGTEVGGTTTGTIIDSGGFQEVDGNAGDVNIASGTTVNNGGTFVIVGTGSFVGLVVNHGGTVEVVDFATLNGYVVTSQTTLLVGSLGVASGALVDPGANLIVSSGGTTSDTTISGGTATIASGGIVTGTLAFTGTGGTLDLVSGALPTNTIGGFIPGSVIDIAGLTANGASYSSAGGSGTLTLYDGGTQVGSLSVVTTGNPVAFSLVADGSGGTDLAVSAATPPSTPSGLALSGGGSSTTQTNPTISGSGTTGDTVTLYEGETALGSATITGGGWSITTTSALSAGTHNLVATQVDGSHDVSSPSSPLSITVGAAGQPTVTPHNQSVAYSISVALSSIFTLGGGAATSYNVYLASPNDGTVTGGSNPVSAGSVVAESAASFAGMNFVGSGVPGSDALYLQAVNGAGSSLWVEAVLTEPGVPADVVTAHPASVAFTQPVALSTLFTVAGNAPTQYDVYLVGPNDGSVTDTNGAIATGTIVNEASLTGVNFVGGLAAGGDQLYLRAYDGQWSAWTLATPADTGAVSANNQSVAYTQSVALSSIFTVSGSGSITGYNVYLASPNDGTVTGGSNLVTAGVVAHETSLAGMNFVGSGVPGSDALYLQAVTAQGTGTWTQAVLTEPGVPPDVVTAHPASVVFTQPVALSTLFTVAGNAPTQYDVYLIGPNDGTVTGGNNPVVANTLTEEDNLTGMNFVGGLAAGGDQVYLRAYDGQWSAWTLATPTDTGAVSANNQSVAYNQSVALSSIFTVSGGGSITGYNIYLASPNDGTVTGGSLAVTPGVVAHETSLAGINFVGSGVPGSDVLYLQAVDNGQMSNWVAATLTEPGVAPDTVSAGGAGLGYLAHVGLGSLFFVTGPTPTQYQVYLVGSSTGSVTDGNGAIPTDTAVTENSLTNVNLIGGLSAGTDQIYLRTFDGQWSNWALATANEGGSVYAHRETVSYNQETALSNIFTTSGGGSLIGDGAITSVNIYFVGSNDGVVTDGGGNPIPTGQIINETNLSNMNFVGGLTAGMDTLYLQAVTPQGNSNWVPATLTDTGAVSANNQSVAYNQSVALSSIFTVSGGGSITGYNIYLASPNDGTVTGGTAVTPGVVAHETSLAGINFVGGLANGADQLYLQAVTAQGAGTWTPAALIDTGAVSAANQTVAYNQSVALSSIFTVSGGGSITGYNIYLASPNDGSVTGGNPTVTAGVVAHETSLAGMNFVRGPANGADQLWLQAVNGQQTGNWVEAIITNQSGANDTVSAGSGNNDIYMGDANQTLLDGSSVYNDTVMGFAQANGDRIHLTTDTISNALGHSTQVNGGADTLITLSDNSTILLKGVAHIDVSFFS